MAAVVAGLRCSLSTIGLSRVLLYSLLPSLTVGGALVSLAVPVVLGPARFGQYSLVEALFRYGVAFDMGLSVLADRRLPVLGATGLREQAALASTLLWLRLYIASAALGAAVLVLPVLGQEGMLHFDWPLGMVALSAGVLGMLVNGPASTERASSHSKQFAALYAGTLAVLCFGRLLGIVAGGVLGCFAVMGLCYGGMALLSYGRLMRPGTRPERAAAHRFFRESTPLFLVVYLYTLLATASRWVIAPQTSPVLFGEFAFGASVTTLMVSMVGGMAQLWYPRLVRRRTAGETDAVSAQVLRDLGLLAMGLAVVSTAGVVLGPWLLGVFYPKFVSSREVVRTILASVPAYTVATWLMPLALATGARPWRDGVLIYLAALASLVGLTIAGFQFGGIAGASWGLVVSMPILVGLQLWRLDARCVLRSRDAAMLFIAVLCATATPGLLALWL